ncbi:MAG: hypothetical protein ACHQU0_02455 [Candidatus Paceibacteria bacterium]
MPPEKELEENTLPKSLADIRVRRFGLSRHTFIIGIILILLAGYVLVSALERGETRNCMQAANGYIPTCSDDSQNQAVHGGDGACKTTSVNGVTLPMKCVKITAPGQCLPC